MSHYKPYPAYKDSGVEWLGQVPEHWIIHKLKWLAALKSGEFITSESIKESGNYPVYGGNGLRGYTESFTHNGDYALIGRQGALCGNINYATGEFWASEHAVVVLPYVKTSHRWIGELLRSMNLNQYSVSAAQPGLAVERITDLYVCIPPLNEQQAIDKHLDRETARIDSLITKKTRFIELLKEKRQALITQAVTKGLDPHVKMKDSGVEWLGEVPEHWEVKPLKYVASPIIGLTYSPEDVVDDESNGVIVLRSSNIKDGAIVLGDNVYVSAKIPTHLRTRIGDILICSRNGSKHLIGKNGLIDKNSAGQTFGAFTTVVRSNINKYLYYILNSALFKYQSSRFLTTTINQLTTETLKSFELPLPNIIEQEKIISYLEKQLTQVDALTEKSKNSITLLKERRSALITAAVTGQIDLREAA